MTAVRAVFAERPWTAMARASIAQISIPASGISASAAAGAMRCLIAQTNPNWAA
jgi:hypothetical protein